MYFLGEVEYNGNMQNTEAISKLHEELVPFAGAAATVEGELVRAVMRVAYRRYNDGDVFWYGYGCETAGPSASYLLEMPQVPGLVQAIEEATGRDGVAYEAALQKAIDAVVAYVEAHRDDFKKNEIDSRDFPSRWTEDADDWYNQDDEDDEEL